jgi:hypothetical protein
MSSKSVGLALRAWRATSQETKFSMVAAVVGQSEIDVNSAQLCNRSCALGACAPGDRSESGLALVPFVAPLSWHIDTDIDGKILMWIASHRHKKRISTLMQ